MIINQGNLSRLYTGFKTSFNEGLGMAKSMYERIATVVPSSTREEKYGWLGKVPRFRKWVGDRVIQNIMAHDYAIKNEPYEVTIGVDRDDIDDDQYGVYSALFKEMGFATAAHPDELVWALAQAGFGGSLGLCYDGQFFFDTDHPVIDENGDTISVANTDGGAGSPWFLLDTNRPLKPIIFQRRKNYDFQAMNKPDDTNVFMRKEFIYGVDARVNVGFGFWQFAWGSKQALDATNYAAAREALTGMKGDYGRPLGVMPNLLVVGPSGESAGRKLLNSEVNAAGATNEWKGTAELLVVPWLA
jgi:phage major head subunit gpT-like protein